MNTFLFLLLFALVMYLVWNFVGPLLVNTVIFILAAIVTLIIVLYAFLFQGKSIKW